MFSIGFEIHGYSLLYVLGEGAHAMVWCALHETTKKKVAIKIKEKMKNDQNEIEILRSMDFKYIIEVFEWFEDEMFKFIVMEYLPNGSLQNLIRNTGGISECLAKKYIYQILLTIDYLHQRKIMHRDIKAENILLDATNDIRLIDFGMSENFSNLNNICGSPAYMAPEMICGNNYDERADLWSIGILIFYLLIGRFPFQDETYQKLFHKTIYAELICPETISLEAKDMLSKLLEKKPDNRITLHGALSHPWLAQSLSINVYKSSENMLQMKNTFMGFKIEPADEVSRKILSSQTKHNVKLSFCGLQRPKCFSVDKGSHNRKIPTRRGSIYVNAKLICPEAKKFTFDFK